MDPIPPYPEVVAAAVRQAIRTSGRTLGSVSTAAGIPRNTLNRRLAGNSPFTVRELDNIASFLGVPVEQFVSARAA